MASDELLSKTISYLRFPLTIGVVFIHYNLAEKGCSMHGVKYGLDSPDWYYWLVNFMSGVLPRLCVPLFFLISGFLFFYQKEFNAHTYQQKLCNRAKTLLIPYLLWNFIAILLVLSHKLPFVSSFYLNAYKVEVHLSLTRLFYTFFANFENAGVFVIPMTDVSADASNFPFPINGALWYVRDLMVMVLLSPVICWLIKRAGWWFILLLGCVWYFYQTLFMPDGGWSVLLSWAVFFFSWGAYYSINKISFVDSMRKYKYAPLLYLFVALADSFTKKADYNIFIREIGILFGIVSAVVIVSYLLEKGMLKVNETLAQCSFFVFALHNLIITDIGKLLFGALRLPDNTYALLFLYFVTPVLTVGFCVMLYVLLRRYVPLLRDMLTGGR